MNKNQFFREATIRISNTLDIENALNNTLGFIKNFLPADGCILSFHDYDRKVMKIITHATSTRVRKLPTEIAMPPGYESEVKLLASINVDFVNRKEKYLVSSTIAKALGFSEISFIVLRLKIDNKRLGQLIIYRCESDAYRQENADMVDLLHDPFAIALANVLKHREVLLLNELLSEENQFLHEEEQDRTGDRIVGDDFGLKVVMGLVKKVAPLNSPVLLVGETGVGKEVIANAIHHQSLRHDQPFIKINCGAIPEYLIDSELFGHEKGAFTGAIAKKRGRFERANQGTILLDEIGELPLQAQVRLLRVLQNKEIERVGGTEVIPVDVRIIAATHKDLEAMIGDQNFREDLFFRLNVFPLLVPPLRERKEDIPALVNHFIDRKMREFGMRRRPELALGCMESLQQYDWPGNVREVENRVERAIIENRGEGSQRHLTFDLQKSTVEKKAQTSPAEKTEIPEQLDEMINLHIQRALKKSNNRIHGNGGAAELLGINPNTLRGKMRKLGIPFGNQSNSISSD